MSTTKLSGTDFDKIWPIILKYLPVRDQIRNKRVCKQFQQACITSLKCLDNRKGIRQDEEVSTLVKLEAIPKIVELEGPHLSNDGVSPLFTSEKLNSLRIVDCDLISDKTLELLRKYGSQLEELDIDFRPVSLCSRNGYNGQRNMRITDLGLKNIAKGCKQLKRFSLRWYRETADETLAELCTNCDKLESLRLCWVKAGDKLANALATRTTLVELDLRQCREFTEAGLNTIFDKPTTIRSLILVDLFCTDMTLIKIGFSCGPNLKTLLLSDLEGVTDIGLKELSDKISKLENLHLSHLKNITDEGVISLLSKATLLHSLEIHWSPITDEMLIKLSSLEVIKSLRVVRLDGLKGVTDAGFVPFVKACHGLQHIECFNSKVTSACLDGLKHKDLKIVLEAW